jgi:hypothetical protein
VGRRVATTAISVDERDRMRWWTWMSFGGVAAAMVLALLGGFPFDTPMPTHSFGWVDPTCGLTRGSTAIARGDLALAWRYNPTSFLVMGFGVAGVIRAGAGITKGRWLNVSLRLGPFGWVLVALAVIALTAYQQSNAEFIIRSRA